MMADRKHLDQYYTPPGMVIGLLGELDLRGRSKTVLEPCCGDGAISRFLPHCHTNDIDPAVAAATHHDVTQTYYWNKIAPPCDWVISNLPFNEAYRILPLALDHARVGVAFILRLSFLEPTGSRNARGEWLEAHTHQFAHLQPFGNPRYSFTQNGRMDSVTVAWMMWRKDGFTFKFVANHWYTNWKPKADFTQWIQNYHSHAAPADQLQPYQPLAAGAAVIANRSGTAYHIAHEISGLPNDTRPALYKTACGQQLSAAFWSQDWILEHDAEFLPMWEDPEIEEVLGDGRCAICGTYAKYMQAAEDTTHYIKHLMHTDQQSSNDCRIHYENSMKGNNHRELFTQTRFPLGEL